MKYNRNLIDKNAEDALKSSGSVVKELDQKLHKDLTSCSLPDNYFSKIEESILASVRQEDLSAAKIRTKLTKYLNDDQKPISRGTIAPALHKLERYKLIASRIEKIPRKSGDGFRDTKIYKITEFGLKKYLEQKDKQNKLEAPLSILVNGS